MTTIDHGKCLLVLFIAASCSSSAPADDPSPPVGQSALPLVSSETYPLPPHPVSISANYVVPTEPELARDGEFFIDNVDWIFEGTTVTMHYFLPVGLVGGDIEISMSGPMNEGDCQVTLQRPKGTMICSGTLAGIECSATYVNLGPLPIDEDLVRSVAEEEGRNPNNRVDIVGIYDQIPVGQVVMNLPDHAPPRGMD